jgi:hypothetical protein
MSEHTTNGPQISDEAKQFQAVQERLTVGAAVNVLFWVEIAKRAKVPTWVGAAGSITAMRLASKNPEKLGALAPVVKVMNLPGSVASGVLVKKPCCAPCALGMPCDSE